MSAVLPEILDETEIRALTKRRYPKIQCRILEQLGIPYRVHPVDGSPVVYRDALSARPSGDKVTKPANEDDFTPAFDRVR